MSATDGARAPSKPLPRERTLRQEAGQAGEIEHRFLPRQPVGVPGVASRLLRSPFPPIDDYAFLSDREVNALVAPSGNVEWMCLPKPDGPSVFGSILDRAAGGFRLSPDEVMVPAGRRYLPGTMVLETTWRTSAGWVIVRDALVIGPWHSSERREGYRRPPEDHEAEQCLLRTVRCVSGTVALAMSCEPVFDYGRVEARWTYRGGAGTTRPSPPGSPARGSCV